jgi:hypothetical protein
MKSKATVAWSGIVAAVALAGWAAAAGNGSRGGVAIVYELEGTARSAPAAGKPTALELFDWVPEGAKVDVGAASRLSLVFANGTRYELGAAAEATLGAKGLDRISGAVRALDPVPVLPKPLRLDSGESPGERVGAIRLRRDRISRMYPWPGASALAEAAVLTFEPVVEGLRYRVEVVRDADGRRVFEIETDAHQVKIPEGVLQPGRRYSWNVRTVDTAGWSVVGDSGFDTLDEGLARDRAALRAALAKETSPGAAALSAELALTRS